MKRPDISHDIFKKGTTFISGNTVFNLCLTRCQLKFLVIPAAKVLLKNTTTDHKRIKIIFILLHKAASGWAISEFLRKFYS